MLVVVLGEIAIELNQRYQMIRLGKKRKRESSRSLHSEQNVNRQDTNEVSYMVVITREFISHGQSLNHLLGVHHSQVIKEKKGFSFTKLHLVNRSTSFLGTELKNPRLERKRKGRVC